MRSFFKYFFGFLIVLISLIFFFLKSDIGHQNLEYFIEDYLSKKTYNKIKISSLELGNYPYLVIALQINDTAKVTLKGEINNYNIDMTYHLIGDSFKFNNLHLKDKIDVQGELFGAFDSLEITGDGEIFEGEVSYKFTNIPQKIKDFTVQMKKVNSIKLLNFMEERELIAGFVDIDASFECFSKYSKQGQAEIHMDKATIPTIVEDIPFVLNSTINFQNVLYKYEGDISSDIGTMVLKNGHYHEGTLIARGDYEIHLKDLEYFEKIAKYNYKGTLDISGSMHYDVDKEQFNIKGETKQFGGDLTYLYRDDSLDLILNKVSLERLLTSFSYPIIFTSSLNGTIKFNLKEKSAIINMDLKDTHFVKSVLSDILYRKAEIDILLGLYDKSYFSAGYQNNKLSFGLKIDDGKGSIELIDSSIDVLNSTIESKFGIKMQGQEVFGKIYGEVDDPKVWIDKEKLIQYQTDKHLGAWLGTK